jgi:AcrR family transcriptional regulator
MATAVSSFPHGRVPRAIREQQILELAEELFSERGYPGTSMAELARRAGVTKPVVYELFGSKEGLYRACVERSAARLAEVVVAAVQGEEGPAAKLRAGGLAFLRFAERHRVAWDVLFLGGDARFATEAAGIRRRQAALVAGLMAEGAREDVDPLQVDAMAHVVNAAYEALASWASDHPDVPVETLADWLVELLEPGLGRYT